METKSNSLTLRFSRGRNNQTYFGGVISAIGVYCLLLLPPAAFPQNAGINATGNPPNAKALLDLDATGISPKTGLLIPRMTTAERNAITAPIPESLLIYNTTTKCFEWWDVISSTWISMSCNCQLPGSFIATAASGITVTAFDANWTVSNAATIYYLDVATDVAFTTFVTGYNNLNVGNVLTYSVNTNLACGTTYYYRVRANNTCGTSSNSNTITVTTPACGTCGTQVFALANINVGTRINGLPTGQNMTAPGGDQKYCYNDIEANCTTYGGLYEWGEAMNYAASINCDPCGGSGVQGICPAGYHIPTDLEWSRYEYCIESTIAPTGATTLATFQTTTGWRGTNSTAGPGAKMKVTSGNSPAWDGTNTSGFTALPAGYRFSGDGSFRNLGSIAIFLSATEDVGTNARCRTLNSGTGQSARNNENKAWGYSVRCLQN